MSLFGEKERQAVEYVADTIEDFDYAGEAAKTGTVAGLAGAGAALSNGSIGLGALSFAFGNFSHNVSTELASREEYRLFDGLAEEEVEEMMDEDLKESYLDEELNEEDPEAVQNVPLDEGEYDIEKRE
ncbi:hypothetical protein GKQ38_00140 [Candidatus Nanohaloarchaea archaeon]|nr:hypothetical protein GKQ38_00140 [Candidatus Nanohaloarchaea archaeon]